MGLTDDTIDRVRRVIREGTGDGSEDLDIEEALRELCECIGFDEYKTATGCGGRSFRKEGTPKGLYRLLYLFRPAAVDFSDMYKTTLFAIGLRNTGFVVEVDLFKYELGLYFYAPRSHVRGRPCRVVAGHPDADNGWKCTDPTGRAFFELICEAAGRRFCVYAGNDFYV